MNCSYKGCVLPATCALAINIPATGVALADHDPIQMILGLILCDECFKKINHRQLQEIMSDELRATVLMTTSLNKVRPPDFSRAFASRISFDSKEWQDLQSHRRGLDDAT